MPSWMMWVYIFILRLGKNPKLVVVDKHGRVNSCPPNQTPHPRYVFLQEFIDRKARGEW